MEDNHSSFKHRKITKTLESMKITTISRRKMKPKALRKKCNLHNTLKNLRKTKLLAREEL